MLPRPCSTTTARRRPCRGRDAFKVHADWQISPLAALLLGGEWQLAAYVESIGAGPEQQVGPTVTVPLTGATNYSADIAVAAGTLPNNPAPPASGVYKTVTVLTHTNFGAVTDVVGIVEGLGAAHRLSTSLTDGGPARRDRRRRCQARSTLTDSSRSGAAPVQRVRVAAAEDGHRPVPRSTTSSRRSPAHTRTRDRPGSACRAGRGRCPRSLAFPGAACGKRPRSESYRTVVSIAGWIRNVVHSASRHR